MKKDGTIYKAGDYNIPFTMQSISKTFSLILALQTAGYDKVFSKIGMERLVIALTASCSWN